MLTGIATWLVGWLVVWVCLISDAKEDGVWVSCGWLVVCLISDAKEDGGDFESSRACVTIPHHDLHITIPHHDLRIHMTYAHSCHHIPHHDLRIHMT